MFKLFTQKTNDYETISKRLTDVINEVETLKSKVKGLELENDDLRNKVLRKIQRKTEETEEKLEYLKAGQKVRR